MISEYHINLVLGKMDKILENQRMILQQLVANNNKIGGKLPPVYEPEPETPKCQADEATSSKTADTCTEASVPVGHESLAEGLCDNGDSAVVCPRPSKELSKTQLFKSYRDKGGKLSWNKWKAAGMPQE